MSDVHPLKGGGVVDVPWLPDPGHCPVVATFHKTPVVWLTCARRVEQVHARAVHLSRESHHHQLTRLEVPRLHDPLLLSR